MNEKMKRIVGWALLIIGTAITLAAFVLTYLNWNEDWCRTLMITGFAIGSLGMVLRPITQNEIVKGTARSTANSTYFCSILAASWFFMINHFTPAIIVVLFIDLILLIVGCFLAYKKKQQVTMLEDEFVNAKNEKIEY